MCEYCGCQALRPIIELTAEHTAALDLIDRGRQAAREGSRCAATAAARELLALLGPHTAVEEEALLPAMAREHAAHVAVLQAEHQSLHTVLARVAAGAQEEAWAEVLVEALQLLHEHIYKEQDGLFPAALIELDPADWEHLETVRARVGSALTTTTRGTR